ncbi:hypothetical protein E2C01_034525 [Portunus trituberculatus]|uniref:Uncharacterized protein n=1 Tax=Portunus trituberculatus TaxID=210409 RepID=A0A5B7F5Z9_PORTR|nr:hypothetical protein [Portunus trituberculatus]
MIKAHHGSFTSGSTLEMRLLLRLREERMYSSAKGLPGTLSRSFSEMSRETRELEGLKVSAAILLMWLRANDTFVYTLGMKRAQMQAGSGLRWSGGSIPSLLPSAAQQHATSPHCNS